MQHLCNEIVQDATQSKIILMQIANKIIYGARLKACLISQLLSD